MRLLFLIFFLIVLILPIVADSTQVSKADSLISQSDSISKLKTLVNDSVSQVLKPLEAKERFQGTELWVFIVCCLTFFLAGINRRINEKKHDQSILGFIKLGPLGQATDRSFYEFNIHQLIGLIVHNLILALWTFYFLQDTEYQFVQSSTLLFFVLLFFLISIIYLFKFFFQYLALNILQINDLPVLLVKCTIGLGYLSTLISLPLFMIIYYVQHPEWHHILLVLFMILMVSYLLFRAFKYLQLFAQFFNGSIFYNILYFCGLELVPLLVFIKISLGIF
jgi:hypothetical protein